MTKTRLAIGAAIVGLLVVGGGVVAERRIAERQLAQGLESFRAALGPDAVVSTRSRRTRLLSRGAIIEGLTVQRGAQTLSAENVYLAHVRDDRLGRVEMQGVRLANPTGTLTIRDVQVDDLILPRTVGAAPTRIDLDALGFHHAVLHDVDAKSIDGDEVVLTQVDAREYGQGRRTDVDTAGFLLTSSVGGRAISIGQSHLRGALLGDYVAAVNVGTMPPSLAGEQVLELDDLQWRQGGHLEASVGAVHSRTKVESQAHGAFNLDITNAQVTTDNTDLATDLRALGYEKLTADLKLDGTYDRDGGEMHLAPLQVSVKEGGTLELDLSLGGFPAWSATPSPADWAAVQIKGLHLVYTDASLYGRLVQATARRRNMSTDDLNAEIAAALTQGAQNAPAPLSDVAKAALDFVHKPGVFELKAQPKDPVPLLLFVALMSAPDEVAKALNLSAQTR